MSHPQLYLKSPQSKPIQAQVLVHQHGPAVRLQVKAGHLEFELLGLRDELLAMLTPPPLPQAAAQRFPVDVLGLTPADVVRYFEQSPVLHIYAADVRTTVLAGLEATGEDYQHQQDLQAVKHLKSPSQADIAQALFGDRTKTGGAYRRRILAVMSATTTGLSATTGGSRVKRAA